MKMRLTPSVAAQGAWLIAGRSAAGAVLLALAVSACTANGPTTPNTSVPSVQTSGTSPSGPGTRTPSPGGGAGSTSSHPATHTRSAGSPTAHASSSVTTHHTQASVTPTPTPTHTQASVTPTPTHTHASVTPSPTPTLPSATTVYPTAAPETGGGGTAGLQDGLLFGAGGAAVLAGLGALAYRRRLSRKFGIGRQAAGDQVPRDPANR